jgi:5-methylcytosine-specific restriction endonuclease McrA
MPRKYTPEKREYDLAYYAAHRDERLAYQVTYRASHPDAERAYHAAYRTVNREKRRAAGVIYQATHAEKRRAYRREHIEEHRLYQALYYSDHPEVARAKRQIRRARLCSLASERVLISELFVRDRGICGICGKRVYKQARDKMMRPSHDHILPVSKGGANTYANSRLTHRRCNVIRGNRGAAQLRMSV